MKKELSEKDKLFKTLRLGCILPAAIIIILLVAFTIFCGIDFVKTS